MSLVGCQTCQRMISLSILPGGNPIAKMYPEMFAMRYGKCRRCGKVFCEECLGKTGSTCPDCKRSVELVGPPPEQPGR